MARVKRAGRPYDCVIPVSGGKDSTWQAVTCLEHGLRPLGGDLADAGAHASSAAQPRQPDRARASTTSTSASTRRSSAASCLRSFERFGTTAIPMHLAIFNIPLTVAVRYDVPLVVWGENSAAEYIGTGPDADSFRLDAEWMRRYGAVHGTTAADWVSDDLTAERPDALLRPERRGARGQRHRGGLPRLVLRLGPRPDGARSPREHGFRVARGRPADRLLRLRRHRRRLHLASTTG